MYGLLAIIAIYFEGFSKESELIIKKKNKIICIVGFALIALMLGLRHPSMGWDLRYGFAYGYLDSFDKISEVSWNRILDFKILNYEQGYILYNKIISYINDDIQFFIFITAVLSVLPIALCVYKKGCSPVQSFIIYLGLPAFFMCYSGLRQALAIGICCYSITFIQDKKIIKFIIAVLLAYCFHSSSMVFLVAYPAYNIKLNRDKRIISIALLPIIYILRYPLFNILSKFFKDNATPDDNNAITLFLVFSMVYLFCTLYTDYSEEQNGLMNLFYGACVCQAFGGVYQTAMRVGYYFMLPLVLLLPLILRNMKITNDKQIFATVIMVCFGAFGLYSIYTSTWAMAYPYHFFWEVF